MAKMKKHETKSAGCKRLLPRIDVLAAREAIDEAVRLLTLLDSPSADVARFLQILAPKALSGLPMTYRPGSLIRYQEHDSKEARWIDGVVIACTTHVESYVVGPGDDRDTAGKKGKLYMMSLDLIHSR